MSRLAHRIGRARLIGRAPCLATIFLFASFTTLPGAVPVITGVEVVMGSLTESSASITWLTDVPANSAVFYGTNPNNLNLTVQNAAVVTTHILPLAGLTPDTQYFFFVQSNDGTAEPNTNTSGIFSFTTLPGAVPGITGVEVVMGSLTESSASITWMTDVPANSTVFYGTDPGNMNLMVESAALVTTHVVPIAGLTVDTLYFFRVESDDGTDPPSTSTSGIFSFQTLAGAVPGITGVEVVMGSLTESSASITWMTDVPANSTVFYGTDPNNLNLTVQNAAVVTTHILPLAGLTPDTQYFFFVQSNDGTAEPNTNTSGIFSFTTLPGAVPGITGVEVVMGSLTESSASITWMTDVPANSTVFYGTDPGNMNLMVESAALVTTHVVPIAGLTADTLYFFRVESDDGTDPPNTSTSGIIGNL